MRTFEMKVNIPAVHSMCNYYQWYFCMPFGIDRLCACMLSNKQKIIPITYPLSSNCMALITLSVSLYCVYGTVSISCPIRNQSTCVLDNFIHFTETELANGKNSVRKHSIRNTIKTEANLHKTFPPSRIGHHQFVLFLFQAYQTHG